MRPYQTERAIPDRECSHEKPHPPEVAKPARRAHGRAPLPDREGNPETGSAATETPSARGCQTGEEGARPCAPTRPRGQSLDRECSHENPIRQRLPNRRGGRTAVRPYQTERAIPRPGVQPRKPHPQPFLTVLYSLLSALFSLVQLPTPNQTTEALFFSCPNFLLTLRPCCC